MADAPRSHDALDEIMRRTYVLPQDDEETPAKVASLKEIAARHNLEVKSHDRAEDRKTIITFRGTLRQISNANHIVKTTAELAHVFTSELLGDLLEKQPPKPKE